MSNKVIVGVIIAVVVVGGGLYLISKKTDYSPAYNYTPPTQNVQQSPSPIQTSQASPSSLQEGPGQDTVIYTSDGFSPATLTIPAGGKVIWVNNAGDLSLNSTPHPTHTDYALLNLGRISSGQSKSLVLDKPGTYRYHNHLNPGQQGTIIVQ